MTIKIILVDDHVNVRRGLRNILTQSPQVEVIAEAGNGKEALELAAKLDPDIVLLDVEMPGMKGYEVARRLVDTGSPVRILALSGYDEKRTILGMFSSGAVGYLTKDEAPQQLLKAVDEIAAGRKGWISPKVAERLGAQAAPIGRHTIPALTPLEKEILRCMAEGKTDYEIMLQLGLDKAEIKETSATLMQKLGVKTRPETVLRAMQAGLV